MRKLRELRKANNLTIAKAAEELNIPFETYRSYEIGRNQADYDTLIKVAKFFGVSVDYLLGLEDDFGVLTAAPMGDNADLTEKEKALLKAFKNLLPETQDFVLRTAQSLSDKNSAKTLNKN